MNLRNPHIALLALALLGSPSQVFAQDAKGDPEVSVLSDAEWRKRTDTRLTAIEEQLAMIAQRFKELEARLPAGPSRKVTDSSITPVVREGAVAIDNRRGTYQSVSVNGFVYTVAPGKTEIWVPFGPVEVFLRGIEPPRLWNNWRWNGRHYELGIFLQ